MRVEVAAEHSSTVAVGVDFKDRELATRIRTGVERIVDLIATELSAADQALTGLARPDGRCLRPLITVACAHTGTDPQAWDVTAAGGVVEMVHLATLQHHEVVALPRGGADQRAAERWHNDVAILCGDYLLAIASRLLARLGPDAVQVMAESFALTVTGHMRAGHSESRDLAYDCLRAVREMTGSLTATAGYFGALFGGAPLDDIARTRRLGFTIGTALQISDDIGVIASGSERNGTPANVLRRRYSLPVLYALQGGGCEAVRLHQLMSGSPREQERHARNHEMLELVRVAGVITKATHVATRYAKRAERELAGLPDSAGKRALSALVDHIRDGHSNDA